MIASNIKSGVNIFGVIGNAKTSSGKYGHIWNLFTTKAFQEHSSGRIIHVSPDVNGTFIFQTDPSSGGDDTYTITTSDGFNWSEYTSIPRGDISYYNGRYTVIGNSFVKYSSSLTSTWNTINTGVTKIYYGKYDVSLSTRKVLVVGGVVSNDISVSTDGGVTWTPQSIPTSIMQPSEYGAITCMNNDSIIVAYESSGGDTAYSSDFGKTWINLNTGTWDMKGKRVWCKGDLFYFSHRYAESNRNKTYIWNAVSKTWSTNSWTINGSINNGVPVYRDYLFWDKYLNRFVSINSSDDPIYSSNGYTWTKFDYGDSSYNWPFRFICNILGLPIYLMGYDVNQSGRGLGILVAY